MAIQHIVLSKFRPEIDEEGKAKTFEIAKGLLRQIPDVKRAAVGPPINDGMARGYDYAMIITFDSPEGFGSYLEHPKHLELVKSLGPFTRGMIAYQIDTSEPTSAKL